MLLSGLLHNGVLKLDLKDHNPPLLWTVTSLCTFYPVDFLFQHPTHPLTLGTKKS